MVKPDQQKSSVLELRSRGCKSESHVRHCIVSLSKTIYPLPNTGSTQEGPFQYDRKIVGWVVKNQNKQNNRIRDS